MKMNELRQLDSSALARLLSEELEKLRDLRFKAGQGELKNIREIRTTKKLIARILGMQGNSAALKINP